MDCAQPCCRFSQVARCRPIFRLRAGVQSDSPPSAAGCGHHKAPAGLEHSKDFAKKMSRATLDCAQPCCRFSQAARCRPIISVCVPVSNPASPPSAAGCGHHKAPAELEHSKDFAKKNVARRPYPRRICKTNHAGVQSRHERIPSSGDCRGQRLFRR